MLEGDALAAWLRARAGKLTASRMGDAIDFTKKGEPSQKRSDYMRELLAERLTGDSVRHFVSDAMRWGQEKEAEARGAYETHTGAFVIDAGLYDHQRIGFFAATPDGLLDGGGLIEFKCPTTPKYVGWVLAGIVPAEHEPQMLAQMACTGRKWCEFVAYNPRVPKRPLFVRRYEPAPEKIAAIEEGAERFLAELDALWEAFHSAGA